MLDESWVKIILAGIGVISAILGLWRVVNNALAKQLEAGSALNASVVEKLIEMQGKVATTLDNHLSSVARSLALVEDRLEKADRRSESAVPIFYKMQSDIDLIKTALVNSTIVPPGTRATVEPLQQSGPTPVTVENQPVKVDQVKK